jgi:electron transport complex protein RnfG
MVGPVVILLAICVIITFALAAVYQMTEPAIRQGEIDAANEARALVLAGAESFTEITAPYPDGVGEVFKADNGIGYVIRAVGSGFGGPATFMIGVDTDGNVVGIMLFDHNETPGLGSKIAGKAYLGKYIGGVDPDSVDSITGATISSAALKEALHLAREAYAIAKGM